MQGRKQIQYADITASAVGPEADELNFGFCSTRNGVKNRSGYHFGVSRITGI